MRWLTAPARGWHRWFAWHPVVVGDQWVWLETVERLHRETISEWWEYR